MKTATLSLWMNGQKVGYWTRLSTGKQELRYCEEWLNSPFGRPLSLSLPFSLAARKGDVVRHYFENLLPENENVRNQLARRFHVPLGDTFALLGAIGRDCVGAIQILKEDECPSDVNKIDGIELTESDIAKRLRNAVSLAEMNNFFPNDEFRISLAGFQTKLAFLFHDGHWMIPRGSTPTTHIFKLPMGRIGPMQADFSSSVDNEWLCLRLCNVLGLPAAQAEIMEFEDQRVLVVERFDRSISKDGNRILRLPQEDFCQALGLPSSLKYESDGGPGTKDIFNVLNFSAKPQEDKNIFLSALLLFWLLRATDGHAKNFSISLLPGGKYQLTKLYDIVSTWPAIGSGPHQLKRQHLKFAMALDGKRRHWRMDRIEPHHFMSTALAGGVSNEEVTRSMLRLLEQVPQAIEKVTKSLPDGFSSSVADKIFEGLYKSSQELSSKMD